MKNWIKVLLGLIIGGVFLWLAFRKVELETIIEASKGASFWWFIPFTLVTLSAHYFRAERWRLLLTGETKVPPRFTLFTGVMFGYLANIPFARLGEVTRPVYVAQQVKESNSKLIGTIVLERIIDMLTLLALMAFVVVFMISDPQILHNLFGVDITDSEVLLSFVWSIVKLGAAVLFALLAFYYLVKLGSHQVGWMRKLLLKMRGLIRTFIEGILAVRELKQWRLFILYTVLIWACYISMTYLPFWMFDMQEVFGLTYADALVLTMVSAVGIIIPTPGGVGTYHLFITKSLFLLYAVPEAIGLSYATIAHASTLVIILIVTPLLLAVDKFVILKFNAAEKEP